MKMIDGVVSIIKNDGLNFEIEHIELVKCYNCKHYDSHDHRCKVWNHGVNVEDFCSLGEKGKKNDMRDFLKALLNGMIVLLILLVIVFSIVYIGFKFEKREDQKKYNGGICPRCGGNYIYEQAVAHKYDTDYIYICDICGDMIELESYRPQERKEE